MRHGRICYCGFEKCSGPLAVERILSFVIGIIVLLTIAQLTGGVVDLYIFAMIFLACLIGVYMFVFVLWKVSRQVSREE